MTALLPDSVRDRLSDPRRLAVLARLGLMDTPRDGSLDRLARLAARLLDTPAALVNLVGEDRQFCASAHGLPEPWAAAGVPVEFGFCAYVVASGEPLIVPDMAADPRFRGNPAVEALRIGAYVGVPLVTGEGAVVGTICAFDHEPREWTGDDVEALQDLAVTAVAQIELGGNERRLREAEERFRLAVTAARLGTWRFDPETGLVELDERMREIRGEPPGAVTLHFSEALDRLHPDDRSRVVGAVAAALEPDSTGLYGVEYRIIRSDGSIRWVAANGRAQFVGDGDERRAVGFVGTALDIDDRKHAEQALQASEARFRHLADALPQIAWIGGPDGSEIEYLNRQWATYTGISAAESAAQTDGAIHPDDRARTNERFRQALAAGTAFEDEIRLRGADGVYRWFLTRAVPIRNCSGVIVNWFGTSTDIDALKRVQEERLAFVDAAAHDLKNPLTALTGQAQLLRRRLGRLGADAGELEPGLAAIEAAAERAGALIDELLDAAHIRAGRGLELRRDTVDLVALGRRVVEEHGRATDRHAVRLESEHPALVGPWDESRLERVLANLIGNAIKFSPAGGAVVLRVWREEGPAGPTAVVSVSDEGVGIPAVDQPRIFDRFVRGGNAVGAFAGAGIGLAGARQIVEQHGGTMTVESTEGIGSTFTVRLPLDEA